VTNPLLNRQRTLGILTVACVAAGVVWRGFGLGTFPGLDPDEVEGVLAWFRDPPILWYVYPTGRPHLNPLAPLLHWPFHMLMAPSAWGVRMPGLIAGLCAIPIAFFALRRAFGARTAALTTMLVSAAPFLVAYSRQAWDLAYVPAFAALIIGTAFAGRPRLTAALVAFGVLVHPTMVCVVPIAAAPTVVDLWRRSTGSSRSVRLRSLLAFGALLTYAAVFLGLMLFAAKLPLRVESLSLLLRDIQDRASDWTLIQTFFSCFWHAMAGDLVYAEFLGGDMQLDAVWPAIATTAFFVASAGLLWKQGRTDRLVFLVALLLGVAGQFITVGNYDLLIPLKERYFLWAALPVCVALVFFLEAVTERLGAPVLSAVAVLALTVTWFVSFQIGYFSPFSRWGGESASLDYRTAPVQPKARVLEIVAQNRRSPEGPAWLFVGEPRLELVLEYLASADPSVRVLNLGRVLYQHQRDNQSDLGAGDVTGSSNVFFVDYLWQEVTGEIREVHALSERTVESAVAPWKAERIGTVTTTAGSPLFGVWRLSLPPK